MAKIKVILISLILLISVNKTYAYEISDLIKILIDKNENSSSFKYDDLIDDLDLKNANLSLIHISEPTRLRRISYAVFCLKKKNTNLNNPSLSPSILTLYINYIPYHTLQHDA